MAPFAGRQSFAFSFFFASFLFFFVAKQRKKK